MIDEKASSRIIDDAQEKICDTLVGLCAGQGNAIYKLIADQVLAISGTTDIKCPECLGKGWRLYNLATCPHCDRTGITKHKWEIGVHLENGELPPVQPYHKARSTQQDMLNAGYVQKVGD